MSLIGYILLISGWLLALTSLVLLAGTAQRLTFIVAALLVELLGLALVTHHYRLIQRGSR